MKDPTTEFQSFPKMARLSRECIITEKLDGTNAQILIVPAREVSIFDEQLAVVWGDQSVEGAVTIFAGSRTRWINPGNDNYGFAGWVRDNAEELAKLGPGRHYGEWWGAGIQRRYGLTEKRFSLFNASRWVPDVVARNVEEWGTVVNRVFDKDGNKCDCCGVVNRVFDKDGNKCDCCGVVPILYRGDFSTGMIEATLAHLGAFGSVAAPGFRDPEGIIVYHIAAGIGFKKTLKDDASPKSLV